jgi:hypothetical protein
MSAPDFGFLANDILPSCDTIVAVCQAAGYDRSGITLCNQPSGPIIAWVKCGLNVAMAGLYCEVPHCQFSSRCAGPPGLSVRDTSDCAIGYIVMQYIDAPIAARETTSWFQGLCKRLLASKVRAPPQDPSC